ncbi:immunoglobulin-like domain-containing protein [Carnobacterium divergens]|uniref:immunoglobulin-like domain-containing protein n=1 Tax=Carnobacterium divergens TaxID=2748 RepID=UPI00128C65A5|nr:immunoglobulin-like domain-containing protein [Carnobacterium divergens]MPQ21521.1 sortase [Carnobacterium divergens]
MPYQAALILLTSCSISVGGLGVIIRKELTNPEILSKAIQIPYHQKVDLNKIKIEHSKKNLKLSVVKGTVNTNKIGDYNVTVALKESGKTIDEEVVTILVKDETPPVISAKDSYEVEVHQPFQLGKKITITDNVDGDITNVSTLSDYQIDKIGVNHVTISANDESGNKINKITEIKVVDNIAPVLSAEDKITNIGESIDVMTLVTAKDNYDGDLTSKVTETGKVDWNKVGKYPVNYEVKDQSGNQTILTKTVTVKDKAPKIKEPQATITQTKENQATSHSSSQVNQKEDSESTPSPVPQEGQYQPKTVNLMGESIHYENAGQSGGQNYIDTNSANASTWGGAAVQSGTDGLNTHIIGHNPGAFSGIWNLGVGSIIIVTDAANHPTAYHIQRIYQVTQNAVGIVDGVNYWDRMIGTGGGERITIQTCENSSGSVDWVIEASA